MLCQIRARKARTELKGSPGGDEAECRPSQISLDVWTMRGVHRDDR